MKKKFVCILLALVLVLGCVSTVSAASHPFTDVKAGAWYEDEVAYCYNNSLMNGTSATTFEPETTMNRAMMAVVLYRIDGTPKITAAIPFTDVKTSDYCYDAVRWGYNAGITNGTSGTQFSPNGKITREQMVTMFYRYAGYKGYGANASADLSVYPDSGEIHSYATAAFQWAVGEGIITGTTGNKLDPSGTATRAQCAAVIQRFDMWRKTVEVEAPATDPTTAATNPSPENTEPTDGNPAVTNPTAPPETTAPAEPTGATEHVHNYTATVSFEATCLNSGQMLYKCSCGDRYTEIIDALEHDYQQVSYKEATCSAAGYTKYTCTVCGVSKKDTIAVIDHDYVGVVNPEATYDHAGLITYTCSACGKSYIQTIPKLDGTDNTTAPTTQPTEATKPSSGDSGSSGSSTTEPTNPKEDASDHNHNYKETSRIEASCTANGYITYTCSCGDSYDQAIQHTGHSYTFTSSTAATCTEAGTKTYTCAKCGDSYTESTSEAGHDWKYNHVDEVGHYDDVLSCWCGWSCNESDVPSTYKSPEKYGYTTHSKYYEDNTERDEYQVHSWTYMYPYTNWIVDTPAVNEWTCTSCGVYTTDHDQVTGHTVQRTKYAVSSYCLRGNYSTYKCRDCGYTYNGDYIESTGHNFGVWEKVNDELASRTCTNENCSYTMYDYISAVKLGTTKTASGGCYHRYKPESGTVCIDCGADSAK